MLQLLGVRKSYTTGNFTQVALDDVSIAFRDNEFVAILGPSGSGKTTLLNIIGGLDHYDSGNLIVDGVSTEKYRDGDWDTYRNNRIGFVFQAYNLIPHQTVLSNVELALTLSGVSRAERRQRATAALDQVGLAEHIHKKPSQLSGGQMQRVAIARALINDPEILLADEPTGALDSKTSVQIMGLLTEIARDRLVIMVTHNPELAEEYATRTVSLSDGVVAADTDPYVPLQEKSSTKQTKKTSMSFFTAVALSFNNLMTKKGRTLMTSFAGSIGIIGIAAILSLASGVNAYIKGVEENTLSVYPLTIQSQGLDLTSLLVASTDTAPDEASDGDSDESQSGTVREVPTLGRLFASVGSNDLAALKVFLDNNGGNIENYTNSIEYKYNVTPQIFSADTSKGTRQVNPDSTFASLGLGSASGASFLSSAMSTNTFAQMTSDTRLIEQQYDVLAGHWPSQYDECLVVLSPEGGISDLLLYSMNLRDPSELDAMVKQMANDEEIITPDDSSSFTYEQIMGVSFKLVNATNYYVHDKKYQVWTDKTGNKEFLKSLVDQGEDLHISGIVQAKEGATATALSSGIYYTPALTTHLIEQAAETEIVRSQLAATSVNVFSGRTFADEAANPEQSDLDMKSLISFDESALADAFTIDESKLGLDLSGFNLDLSSLQIDPNDLPPLDIGDLESALTDGLDTDELLKGIDLSALSEGLNQTLSEEDISKMASDILKAYLAYCIASGVDPTDVDTQFPLFLESDQGKAVLETLTKAQEELAKNQEKALAAAMEQVSQAVQDQLTRNSGKIEEQITLALTDYIQQLQTVYSQQIATALQSQLSSAMEQATGQLAANMAGAMSINEDAFMKAFSFNLNEEELTQLLMSMMATEQTSFDGNLQKLGYADFAKPASISIYPIDFESKGQIITILDDYNAQMKKDGNEDKVITYTDIVGTLMSSVTTIVNVISYVLVAFVAISLVVSSIMIGVITYISVLERKKEIGILRSIGASKRDIRRVFNAETLIVGFVAGALGIALTLLLTIPANIIVSARFAIDNVAQLPWQAALILVGISMGLTFLAGLIPSSAASRKDPVEALRSE